MVSEGEGSVGRKSGWSASREIVVLGSCMVGMGTVFVHSGSMRFASSSVKENT